MPVSRATRRLSEKTQSRQIAKKSNGTWQPMVEVPETKWPALPGPRRVVRFWANNKYTCMEYPPRRTEFGIVRRLLIQRVTAERIARWEPLQRIKNEVVGTATLAIEVYPREDDVVNDCHVYHLWVLPEGYPLPGIGLSKHPEPTHG